MVKVCHDGSAAATEIGAQLGQLLGQPTLVELPQDVPGVAGLLGASSSVVLLHCEADGSVSRGVRKLLRALKALAGGQELVGLSFTLLLLGGAKCENSAMSTGDLVYRSGRQLGKLLAEAGATRVVPAGLEMAELDVELADVEAALANWSAALLRPPETAAGGGAAAAPAPALEAAGLRSLQSLPKGVRAARAGTDAANVRH